MGAAGRDVWIFTVTGPGEATVGMEYSQPWEGGEQREWSYTFTVIVQ